ncbi:MAG: Uncharacterized protein CEO21_204 [Microgenomates group bacterium Gr01-1014_80]|nr:MAG: Uncharacterized protein CEO21_204 [Microgenomates group bacterium Gr01-1014_80]
MLIQKLKFKMQNYNLKFKIFNFGLSLLTLHFAFLTTIFAGHCPAGEKHTDLGCIPEDPAGFTAKLYSIGLGFIGGAAVLSIIYGAYLVLSSQGDPGKLQKGKSYIVYAIIGLILAVGGYAFYRIIGKDVVGIPGF